MILFYNTLAAKTRRNERRNDPMKKLIPFLALLCAVLLSFSVMAETTSITWDEAGAPVVEAANIEGGFYSIEELGLAVWLPAGLSNADISEEDAAAGRLYLLTDEEQTCAFIIDAVHVDGMTLDQAYQNAVDSGMVEPEIVNINGLNAVSYKNEAINAGCVVLVDTNSNLIIFSITPIEGEDAELVFGLIMSSIMPLE